MRHGLSFYFTPVSSLQGNEKGPFKNIQLDIVYIFLSLNRAPLPISLTLHPNSERKAGKAAQQQRNEAVEPTTKKLGPHLPHLDAERASMHNKC